MPHNANQGDQLPSTAASQTTISHDYAYFAGGVTASEDASILGNVFASKDDRLL
jgi:hypothetical protein